MATMKQLRNRYRSCPHIIDNILIAFPLKRGRAVWGKVAGRFVYVGTMQ